MTFCLGTATSHGKVQAAGEINDYLDRGVSAGVTGVAVFTWSTLTSFLDEVSQSKYLSQFVDQIEAARE